jgi:hypothetical protein
MFSQARLFLALLAATVGLAQSPQASISGVVTDTQGSVIPGVTVAATHAQTGVVTTTQSNETGFYSLRALPIGEYTITAEHTGFRRSVRQGVRLTTGQSLALDITLELGQLAEAITVTAGAATLETRTSDVAQLVESKTIEDMPLGDRRSMNMINITGAAVFVNYDSGGKPNFSLAGGRTQSQMFWIDGGTGQNMRLGIGQVDMDPPVEVVQEVKILSNNYSAEYGGSAGGVIIANTKSGTNVLRGTLFEYLRNEILDAANFFAPISGNRKIKAPLRYNVFGGTVGGPLRKDRTFFFFAYEGSRRSEGQTRTLTVPTPLQRQGDFSQTFDARGNLIPIYDPATTRSEAGRMLRDPFPGNRIPAGRTDPVAARVVQFYPLPNRPPDGITGANNFRANYVNKFPRNNYTAKIDHHFSDRNKLTGRYLYNSDDQDNTSVFPEPAADTLNTTRRHQHYWFGAWTHIFSPQLINEFRLTYANRINHAFSPSLNGNWPSKLGLKGVADDAFPQINVAGVTALGSGAQERRQFPIQQYQLVNNLSWIKDRHALKFGLEVRPSFNYEVNRPTVSGAFNFSPLATGLPGNANSGFGLASLLVGFPQSFSSRETEVLDRYSWYLAGFLQDDWSVGRSLTLNLGLRWETDTPITDRNNRMNGFDMAAINPVSGTPGVVRFAGVNRWRTAPYDTDWNNLGPRFGFAWRPMGVEKMVVRGGYGIFFAHPFDHGAPSSASLGYELSANLNSPDNGITAPFYLRDGVPGLNRTKPTLDDSFGAVRVGQTATTAVTFFETSRRTGYSQQFNFGFQFELLNSIIVETTYLSNLSRKLAGSNLSINQIPYERLGPNATQRDRPFPQFANVSIVLPALGVSSYHAGMLRIEKRFSHGLNLLATYTFSKFLNNVDEGGSSLGEEGGPYSDFYNRRADWGPSENDVRHRFTFSSVYELPVGKGHSLLTNHPLRHLAGGWAVGSVMLVQSGAPFTVTTQVNTTNAFSAGALRADVLRNPNLPSSERNLNRWFDTDAFRQPEPFRFGNQPVNIVRADGIVNLDLSLLRNFRFGDYRKLQFRAEFFNIANHPNFRLPGRVLGAPGFGIISAANPGRRLQLGLRLVW